MSYCTNTLPSAARHHVKCKHTSHLHSIHVVQGKLYRLVYMKQQFQNHGQAVLMQGT